MTDIDNEAEEGTLPEGWEEKELKEILSLKSGHAYKSKDWAEDGVPVIKIKNVRNGHVSLEGCSFIAQSLAKETSDFTIQEGDLLITLTGEIGATGIYRYPSPARVNQRVARINVHSEKCDFDFCHFLLQSPFLRETMWGLSQGVAQANISPKKVLGLEISLPPLPEQQQIVEILEEQLGRLDAALENVRVVKEKAAQFRRSLLHSAFNGTLTGHTPKEGTLPEGWESGVIEDVAEFVRGVTYTRTDAKKEEGRNHLPLLRATNLQENSIVYDGYVYIPDRIIKPSQHLLQNDLVIATSSGSSLIVGKSGPVLKRFSGTFGAFCAVLRPNKKINARLLHLYAQSPEIRELWSKLARGTNINNLKETQVLSSPIPLPPLPEQQQIVEILEEQLGRLDAALAVAESVEARSAELRRSLLHAAFTGRLTEKWREGNRSLISKGTQ
jgi:type I restriction enzyme, S subunit